MITILLMILLISIMLFLEVGNKSKQKIESYYYYQGYRALVRGQKLSDNPYKFWTKNWSDWNRGYKKALKDKF